MSDQNVVDFSTASGKYRHEKEHEEKEAKVAALKKRFAAALPDKPTPVKDYLQKKRSKKKR